jgi:hypothetical protein
MRSAYKMLDRNFKSRLKREREREREEKRKEGKATPITGHGGL